MNKSAMFSSEFVSEISEVCEEPCADGTCLTREAVARLVAKTHAFPKTESLVLKLLVGEAVRQGAVPGYDMRLGRDGGIYSIAAVAARKATSATEKASAKAERVAERAKAKAEREALKAAEKAARPPVKRGRKPKALTVEPTPAVEPTAAVAAPAAPAAPEAVVAA